MSMKTNSGVIPFLAAFWVLSLCGCRTIDTGAAGFIIWEISEDSVDGAPQLLNIIGTAFRSR